MKVADIIGKILMYILMLFMVFISLAPLVWTFFNSLKTDPMWDTGLFPTEWTLEGYRTIFVEIKIFRNFLNSLIVSTGAVFLSMIILVLAAYVVAMRQFRGKNIFVMVLLSTMFLPGTAMTYPIYRLIYSLNLQNNLLGLILIYSMSNIVVNFFIIRGYFLTVPKEVEESGFLDGCSNFKALFWLVAPIAMPGILTAMVLAFIGFWNEFYFASLFLRSRELMTLTVVLSQFSKGFMVDYTGLFASVIVIIAIPLVCYLSCSKFFISALSGGAVKG